MPTHDPSRPLWLRFLVFLGPMMLSNVLQALSGTINNIYLGHLIGTDALAAAGGFFPVLFFFMALVIGMGAGASVLLGQAWGAGDQDRVRIVAATTLSAALLFGVAAALVLTPLTRPVMQALGTPASVLPSAVPYARIMFGAMPVTFMFLLTTQLLRGVGDTVTPLLALAFAIMVSMLLTPALILGWAGLPRIGVRSAACATVVAWSVSLLAMGLVLRRRGSPLAPDMRLLRAMRPNRQVQVLLQVLRLGIPSGVQMVIMAIAEMVLLGLVNSYGANATAAYGAVNQILAYVQFPPMSMAITVTILSAQAIGAGRADTLPAILRTGMVFNLLITGSLVVLFTVFSPLVVGLFVTSHTVAVETQTLLHIVLWSTVVYGAALMLSGQMRSSGVVMVPTALQIGCVAVVEMPVAWVLSRLIGLDGVWAAYPATFVAMLLTQGGFFMLVWRHRPVQVLAR